ncbi:MAG: cupin domain-containing protein [Chthoniobacterales bacterium]|nr:cupin domain-containing protein [Chthoniobacterales bacterium]
MSGETPIVVNQGDGRVLCAFGEEVVILLDSEQTGGRLTMWIESTPPGGGPPLHFHINDDETFHVLEGRIAFFQNSKWDEVGPGASCFVPRGQVHTFKNTGQETARMLISTAPGGFDVFFTRAAEEFAKPGAPDMARVMGVAAEHGIHFLKEGARS